MLLAYHCMVLMLLSGGGEETQVGRAL